MFNMEAREAKFNRSWIFYFVVQSLSSDSVRPHGVQHTRPPCPSPSLEVCLSSCPLYWWCHPNISSSVTRFSFCPLSFPASGSFPMSRQFTSDDQNTGASASALVLPMNIQGWFPLRLTGLISSLSKGFLGVFSRTTVQRHQFFGTLPSFGIFHTNTMLEVLSPKRGIQTCLVWPQEFKLELMGGSHRKIFSRKGNIRTISVKYVDLVNNWVPHHHGCLRMAKALL